MDCDVNRTAIIEATLENMTGSRPNKEVRIYFETGLPFGRFPMGKWCLRSRPMVME